MYNETASRHARQLGHLGVLGAAAIALSGCTLTPDQGDFTALSAAANQFKSAVSGGAPTSAARADANRARLLQFVVSGSLPPLAGCDPPQAQEDAFDAVAQTGDANTTALWQALLKTPPCGWGLNLEPPASGAPPNQPIITALNDYYAGVAAIASSTSVQQVVDATNKATGALAALANFVPGYGAPASAAAALVGKLTQYGLQTAQYKALQAVLDDVDPLLDKVSGPVVAALRVQQGYWIRTTSEFAGDGVNAVHDAFTSATTPGARLALLQAAQPILDDLAAQQQAVRTDPGAAYLALVTAHHKLDTDLKKGRGQASAVIAAAQDIAGSAQSLTRTPSSTSATSAKKS